MTRTPKTASRTSRWIHGPHRHHWLADTRDQEFSTGRLIRGYGRN
jgi:hypothetical protein